MRTAEKQKGNESSVIRPNTTGELDTAVLSKLPSRKSRTVNAVVAPAASDNRSQGGGVGGGGRAGDGQTSRTVRPRAPRTRNKEHGIVESTPSVSPLSVPGGLDEGAVGVAIGAPTRRSKPKSNVITDLWQELNKFSRNNFGRTLTENSSKVDEIHYVNIGDNDHRKKNVKFSDSGAFIGAAGGSVSAKESPTRGSNSLFSKRDKDSNFVIPELPTGRLLSFDILSTWGDPHYLGLMGIEVFDSSGHLIVLSNPEKQIWADPADINVLPEYDSDPRTVDNLIDGVNHTCDDLHAWLTPFTPGRDHFIFMRFDDVTTVSMIRIWNYNKNRIHSSRGARYLEIKLDNRVVFKGEVRRAVGSHSSMDYENCSECILFTKSHRILGLIEKYDPITKEIMLAEKQGADEKELLTGGAKVIPNFLRFESDAEDSDRLDWSEAGARGRGGGGAGEGAGLRQRGLDTGYRFPDMAILQPRPQTGKGQKSGTPPSRGVAPPQYQAQESTSSKSSQSALADLVDPREFMSRLVAPVNLQSSLLRPSTAAAARTQRAVCGRYIEVRILSSWGDAELIGLTGLSALDQDLEEFSLQQPEVFLATEGVDGSVTRVQNEVECVTSTKRMVTQPFMTVDPKDMWLAVSPQPPLIIVLRFDMQRIRELKGLRVWNYNAAGPEDTCRGVKHVRVYLDNKLHCRAVVRKAPGECRFDFAQFLPLVPGGGGQAGGGGGGGGFGGRTVGMLGSSGALGPLESTKSFRADREKRSEIAESKDSLSSRSLDAKRGSMGGFSGDSSKVLRPLDGSSPVSDGRKNSKESPPSVQVIGRSAVDADILDASEDHFAGLADNLEESDDHALSLSYSELGPDFCMEDGKLMVRSGVRRGSDGGEKGSTFNAYQTLHAQQACLASQQYETPVRLV